MSNYKEFTWEEFDKFCKENEEKEKQRRMNLSEEERKKEDEEMEKEYDELRNLEMQELDSIMHGIYSSADCGIDW